MENKITKPMSNVERDYLIKSPLPSSFSEETKEDIAAKREYVRENLQHFKVFFSNLKVNQITEKYEHGQQHTQNPPKNRKLYGKMYSVALEHLKCLEKEYKRLTLLYNS